MQDKPSLRVRLRVMLALAAGLMILGSTLFIIAFFYLRNGALALDVAASEMDKATVKLTADVNALFAPAARIVEATAAFERIDRSFPHRVELVRYLQTVLAATPQIESIYFGFARDGSFYEAARIDAETKRFGPDAAVLPADARFVLRQLDASSGAMIDSYTYLSAAGKVIAVARGPANYDPRRRPWYRDAWASPRTVLSDAYVFAATGKPGITLSRRIATDAGSEIGAVGADITLSMLTEFLDRERIGDGGRSFIIDEHGRLLGHARSTTADAPTGGGLMLAAARDFADPVIAMPVRARAAGKGERFSVAIGDDTYLASFAPTEESFGKHWTIGAVVDENDVIGPLKRFSREMLAFSGLVLLLALGGTIVGSRFLTRAIGRIVEESRRIRDFDLTGAFALRSRIVEVAELAGAVEAMKDGLSSFGAYVPKALVRSIISTHRRIEIGGRRRALTILFTDIEDFTRTSESLTPEIVLQLLSQYFERMSQCIDATGGIVDKFIGDAVMALWNAPLDDDDHILHACRTLVICDAMNRQLNEAFAAEGWPAMTTRFGLHAGEVIVGNVGSRERMQYTALGDAVNLASRIEGLNKFYGTHVLVTAAIEERARAHFRFRYVDTVVPAGTSHPVGVYELLGGVEEPLAPEAAALGERWSEAVRQFRARAWDDALLSFRAYAASCPGDGVARLYVERCTRNLRTAPAADDDGAEHFDRK